MKSARIVATIVSFIMIFSLFSCDQLHFHTGNNNNNNSHNQHPGYNSNPNTDSDQAPEQNNNQGSEGKITYVYSVVSKMLHLPDCYHVGNIKEDYIKEFTGDISEKLKEGYTICKDCLVPEDEKEDDKEDEEDENLISKEDATYATHKTKLVIHLKNCYTLESMSAKNLRYTDLSLEELLALDYRPCGTCMPVEYAKYKEEHPEEFE